MTILPISLMTSSVFDVNSSLTLSPLDNSLLGSSFTNFITPEFKTRNPVHSFSDAGNNSLDIDFMSDLTDNETLAPVPVEPSVESNLLAGSGPGSANPSDHPLLDFFFSPVQAAERTDEDNSLSGSEPGSAHPGTQFLLTPVMNNFISPPVQAVRVATPILNGLGMLDPDKSDTQPQLPPGVEVVEQSDLKRFLFGGYTIYTTTSEGQEKSTERVRRYPADTPPGFVGHIERAIARYPNPDIVNPTDKPINYTLDFAENLWVENNRFTNIQTVVGYGQKDLPREFILQIDLRFAMGFNEDGAHSSLGFKDPTDLDANDNPTWHPFTINRLAHNMFKGVEEGLKPYSLPEKTDPELPENQDATARAVSQINFENKHALDGAFNPGDGLVEKP